jgi:hypothetical protein
MSAAGPGRQHLARTQPPFPAGKSEDGAGEAAGGQGPWGAGDRSPALMLLHFAPASATKPPAGRDRWRAQGASWPSLKFDLGRGGFLR